MMRRFIPALAILALSCLTVCAAPTSKPKLTSLATDNFTGDEKTPVTLAADAKVPHDKVWKGVDKKTTLIVFRNLSGRDLEFFQLDMSVYPDEKGRGSVSTHGLGQLLKGEKRVIKAWNRSPAYSIRLVWSIWDGKREHPHNMGNSWNSGLEGFDGKNFVGGTLIVFTLNPNNKVSVIYNPPK